MPWTAITDFLKRRLRSGRAETPAIAPHGPEFLATRSLQALLAWFGDRADSVLPAVPASGKLSGWCYVCGGERHFDVAPADGEVNWREALRCDGCGLINRWRSVFHFFELLCRPPRQASIYLTEAVTPLYRLLKERYPNTIGSEYDAARAPGDVFAYGADSVRMEDVTGLTFDDGAFDAVLSFDVLEHVPDYRDALAEFRRVLRPGGRLLLSAPFSFAEESEVRASRQADGTIEHHLPPDYHGDPLSDDGVLCFQSFGMDLLQELEAAGFEHGRLVCYSSLPYAYAGPNILFDARRA